MEFKDYYSVLGVARDAGSDEIKKAYRRLARKYHPDVSEEPDAEARFKEVSEAYEVLKDDEKRQAYNKLGSNWKAGQDFRPPPDWYKQFEFDDEVFSSGSGFSDFFESLFGHSFRTAQHPGGRDRQHARRKGQNQQATVKISLEDAYHGATRKITLGGQGHQGRMLNVKIPKGITTGQKIRLAGQGAPGPGGNGDLLLQVEFGKHPLYRVDKRDIHIELPITPWEAALGATVTVPTLGGKVELKVNPGARSGQKLRLKGRGMPGNPSGDQYVHLQIVTPPADTEQAKDWYRKMAEQLPLDPRAELGG